MGKADKEILKKGRDLKEKVKEERKAKSKNQENGRGNTGWGRGKEICMSGR